MLAAAGFTSTANASSWSDMALYTSLPPSLLLPLPRYAPEDFTQFASYHLWIQHLCV